MGVTVCPSLFLLSYFHDDEKTIGHTNNILTLINIEKGYWIFVKKTFEQSNGRT